MSSTTLVSLEEYLSTSYRPDREYVDGVLLERNVGTFKHGRLQKLVIVFFEQFEESQGIEALPDVRLLVNSATGRHRVPDVMVLKAPFMKDDVITDVPVVIVEVKSPDDTMDDLLERCFDYEKMGVRYPLVMDPEHKLIWLFKHGSFQALANGAVDLDFGGFTVSFPYTQIWAKLER